MKTCRLLLPLLLAAAGAARAEDIDIYASIPAGAGDLPNVILALDASANWDSSIPAPNCYFKDNGILTAEGPKAANPGKEQGTKFGIEKCALYNVIDAMPVAEDGSALVNVGLQMLNESPNNGGYPRVRLLPLTAGTKSIFKFVIRNLTIGGDKGNNADLSLLLYESLLNLGARSPLNGMYTAAKSDHAAFSTWPVGANGKYLSTAASGCARNFIILLANGAPQNGENGAALARLNAEGANVVPLAYANNYISNSQQNNWIDEMARFIRGKDISSRDGQQTAVVHTVAVVGAASDGTYPNLMAQVARQGGGDYRAASNADNLTAGLLDIFNQIIAVNSVFASASLPISVNARGTYKNQIYMGMFRPDRDAKPRWNGNLKQYRFKYDPVSDTLELVDAAGNPAISASTGFIDATARSYWTANSTFWTNNPLGSPPSASDSPDGEVVEKGGAAQVWRTVWATSQAARKVYTCAGGCASGDQLGQAASTRFEDANASLTAAMLGAGNATERTNVINWVRGTDNRGDELGPGGTTTVRPSLHGDVLHSRPAVINYGTRVVVFYGANDGMLHAVQGDPSGDEAGRELWSFVAPEHFAYLKRLRDNSPEVKYPNTPAALVGAQPRGYFFDGPIGVYQKYSEDGTLEKAYIYAAMRRGGRAIYAFDVTDPARPRFMWKRSSGDFGSAMGQTWSQPKVARVRGRANPVIIMGGGYDPGEDSNAEDVGMGNSVLVLDALDGTLVKQFGGGPDGTGTIERAVPADITVVDADFDGYVDRAYAVDLGGNIYRIDFEVGNATDATQWQLFHLAEPGEGVGKKFFYAPDVVLTRNFAAILGGTGDREKPLTTTSSNNFYLVLDRNKGKGVPGGTSTITLGDLPQYEGFDLSSSNGCRLVLDTDGEKVVNAPVTVGGITYFATNKPTPPSPNSCTSNLGLARNYAVPLFCKTPEITDLVGGGLPPSPVGGIVSVEVTDSETGEVVEKQVPFIIGGQNPKKSGIEVTRVKLPVTPRRKRQYWYHDADR